MPLTHESVMVFVKRRMDATPSVPIVELCNQAGDQLVSMHRWQWLIRPSVPVTLVAGLGYFQLPSDFGRFVAMHDETSSSLLGFNLVSPQELALLRTDSTQGYDSFYGSISYAASIVDGSLEARMEVWPSPSATASLRMTYSAGWPSNILAGKPLPMPSWIEPLYLQLVMAFAQGYDENDVASLNARLAEVQVGPLCLNAKERDGSVRPYSLTQRGGAMGQMLGYGRVAIGIATRTEGPSQP